MSAPSSVAVVLAVKDLDGAKSRLADGATSQEQRRALVTAMLADTLTAIGGTGVGTVAVVTPDARVAAVARRFDAMVLAEPTPNGLSPLNAALASGLAAVDASADATVLLQADLAAVDAATLVDAFTAAESVLADGASAAFVADRSGDGTAMLMVRRAAGFVPAFGDRSAHRHRRAGAVELDPERTRWSRLRTDIDTVDDLTAARLLGVGPHTAQVLAQRSVGER